VFAALIASSAGSTVCKRVRAPDDRSLDEGDAAVDSCRCVHSQSSRRVVSTSLRPVPVSCDVAEHFRKAQTAEVARRLHPGAQLKANRTSLCIGEA
jgi:hypothetical protein